MAEKDKVPVAAIRQIIQMRNDEYQNHTYKMIAHHIKNEFGIEITQQAVGYLYRRNKDKYAENQEIKTTIKTDQEERKLDEKTPTKKLGVSPAKPNFKPKKIPPTLSESIFDKDEVVNLTDLFEEME